MYTKKRHPGKFEACESALLGEVLYNSADDATGDVCETGLWVGLVVGKRYSYLVSEDSQGFVEYAVFATEKEARAEFERLQAEMSPDEEVESA